MALERMGIQPFRTEEIHNEPRARHEKEKTFFNEKRKPRSMKRDWRIPTSMLVKLGVCVGACALMLGLKELDTPIAAEMVSGVRGAVNEETDLTEMLGKLQFVELPNALEVFSTNGKMAIPVIAPQMILEPEAQYVMWEGAPNAKVSAAAAGQVRAVGEDPLLGPYVRLLHANELETIYYGLTGIRVEEGQPIRRHDTLGELGESGTLRMHVLLAGEPQPPEQYMDLVIEK